MPEPDPLYDILTLLDRLEDLREDLLELTLRGGAGDDEELDEELIAEEMRALDVRTLGDVEARIAELNEQIDHLDASAEDA
jgi:hypothetical protein